MADIAWIRDGFRPIYSKRLLNRGKNKGKLEVTYRANGNVMRRKIISRSDIRIGEEFNRELRGKEKRV
jgi:hypothetical protein